MRPFLLFKFMFYIIGALATGLFAAFVTMFCIALTGLASHENPPIFKQSISVFFIVSLIAYPLFKASDEQSQRTKAEVAYNLQQNIKNGHCVRVGFVGQYATPYYRCKDNQAYLLGHLQKTIYFKDSNVSN